eukprot:TRINITY_DN8212_c0_g1_i1.p2 TRINITY_DN8212_c0_g1~~TRINITY_DN8212_c0_g1_i1.p2  ORF type:complete len:105 (+),score=21.94 TRINITY_DN8212_c0_g1_i1:35-349(+)
MHMLDTGILPACGKDLAKYAASPKLKLGGEREEVYSNIKAESEKLRSAIEKKPHDLLEEAKYLNDVIKPQMLAVRKLVDKAEGLLEKGLYPYPSYEELLYSHHA